MPDKIKARRVRFKNTLEGRVLSEFKRMSKRPDQRETVHMRLAQRFEIPCQQVLDIIDPDRKRQKVRVARYDARQARARRVDELWREWQKIELEPDRFTNPTYLELCHLLDVIPMLERKNLS